SATRIQPGGNELQCSQRVRERGLPTILSGRKREGKIARYTFARGTCQRALSVSEKLLRQIVESNVILVEWSRVKGRSKLPSVVLVQPTCSHASGRRCLWLPNRL